VVGVRKVLGARKRTWSSFLLDDTCLLDDAHLLDDAFLLGDGNTCPPTQGNVRAGETRAEEDIEVNEERL
jgi:hypothetical protein